jgi:fumarate reductase flavoprotein subunit
MQSAMIETKSIDIDAVSGATVTSQAILAAAKEAFEKATGNAADSQIVMAANTYTGSAWGYNKVEPITATVSVSENAILSIDVNIDNVYETEIKLKNAIDLMVPRIIEQQSIAVDAITGATASSNGIRGAVTKAIKQALAAGGSSEEAIRFFQTIPQIDAKTETIDTDVLVVGLGGSGSYAALRVAEVMHKNDPSSVNVLGIDKSGNYGGTTVLTAETFAVNPPNFMEEHNNGKKYVDEKELYDDWITYTDGDAKEEMVDIIINQSGTALDWIASHGFAFESPERGLDESAHFVVKYRFGPVQGDGGFINKSVFQKCFDAIFDEFESYGGKYMLETEATELLYDAATNRVTGAKAYNKITNTTYIINAKAVITATGGFGGNGEMEAKYLSDKYYPLKGTWNICGSTHNDGKMVQSAINIGAGTYNIGMGPVCHLFGTDGFLKSYPNIALEGQNTIYYNNPAVWSEGDLPMMLLYSPDSLGINSLGKRFLNEEFINSFEAWKGGPDISVIYTKGQIEKIAQEGLKYDMSNMGLLLNSDILINKSPIPANLPLPNAIAVMDDAVQAGYVSKANTIEELADMLNLDKATLVQEFATYNEACESGIDAAYGKPKEYLVSMEEGPYYAIHAGMYCYGTCAGLDTNSNFQVLQSDGKTPINGLYAIGADGQGVLYSEKKAYVTYGGADNGWALTSAYVCGEYVANIMKP